MHLQIREYMAYLTSESSSIYLLLLQLRLVDLLDLGTVGALVWSSTAGAGESARSLTRRSPALGVKFGHNRIGNALELLLQRLELLLAGRLHRVHGLDDLVDLGLEGLLVGSLELVGVLGDGVLERVGVGLETVLGGDSGSGLLVLGLVLLGLGQHSLDLLLGESTLVVGDGNLGRFTGGLVGGVDVEDTVGVDIEGDLDLGNTSGGGGDTSKLEFTKQVAVLCLGSLSLEDLDQDTWLVVGVGGEDLGLLGWYSGVSLDQWGHDTTSGLDTHGQWGNVQEQEVLGGLGGVTSEDSGLNGSTVGDGLVWVDGPVWLSAGEHVGDELLDLGNSGGTADKDDLVDGRLVDLGVSENLLDWVHGGSEEVLAELLESGSGDRSVEVDTVEQGVDLDRGLGGRREGSLGSLTCGSQSSQSSGVGGEVLLVLPLELLDKVVDESVVEVLTTQVGVTGSGLDLEDTLLNGEERDIECTTSEIEDEDVLLTGTLLVETVGDGGGCWLVDDSENVETGDQTSILGGLSLGVVEVGWDGDDGFGNCSTEVGLGGLLHLDEDHGRDLLWREGLVLSSVLDLNDGLATLVNDLEWPVLHVGLDLGVGELSANQSLGVEDGVVWVHGDLVLGGISNQTLRVVEGDVGWGGSVTLVVGNDLNSVILPHGDTRVCGSEIDTDGFDHDE